MASPIVLVNNILPTDGYTSTAAATVTVALQDPAGVTTWLVECIGTDGYNDSVADINDGISINSFTKQATVLIPNDSCGLTFRSIINGGLDVNDQQDNSYTFPFKIKVLTPNQAFELIATNETTEGNSQGWGEAYNENLRKIDAFIPVNGGLFEAGGDLSGTLISQQVDKIQNVTISTAAPTDGYVLTYETSSTSIKFKPAAVSFTAAGDLSGNASSQTVIGIDGNPVNAPTPSDGYVLTWVDADGEWKAQAIPEAAAWTAAGDLSGNSSSQTVIRINGTTVPAGGALTTGTVLRATGAAASDWGSLDLANASAVTGVLPSANVASHTGDVTGAHSATVVAKINGATVPAAGSLTTGNVLKVSGPSAVSYGAVDLSGGSNHVTGDLPIANLAHGSALQYLRTNAGATAPEWVTFPSVLSVAGSINELQINSGSSTLAAATNVVAGTNFIGIGTTPATTGALRIANNSAITWRNQSNVSNKVVLNMDSGDVLRLGDNTTAMVEQYSGTWGVYGGSLYEILVTQSTSVSFGLPRHGNSTPYASEGQVTIALSGNVTLTPAQYSKAILKFTGPHAATDTITLPHPASEDASYKKFFKNTSTNTDLVFTTGTGGTRAFPAPGAADEIYGWIIVTPDGVKGVAVRNSTLGNV